MADRAGYDPGAVARTYTSTLAGPAWQGREHRRLELLAGPDPENLAGFPMALPVGIPGAPPSLRDLAARLVSEVQGRRDDALRRAHFRPEGEEWERPTLSDQPTERGQQLRATAPRRGSRGHDADIRALVREYLEAARPGADLRLTPWAWLLRAEATLVHSAPPLALGVVRRCAAGEALEVAEEEWDAAREELERLTRPASAAGWREESFLWALRHVMRPSALMDGAAWSHAASSWLSAGGNPLEGLRLLVEVVREAPDWPAEVARA